MSLHSWHYPAHDLQISLHLIAMSQVSMSFCDTSATLQCICKFNLLR